jgi:hypothetical protein
MPCHSVAPVRRRHFWESTDFLAGTYSKFECELVITRCPKNEGIAKSKQ